MLQLNVIYGPSQSLFSIHNDVIIKEKKSNHNQSILKTMCTCAIHSNIRKKSYNKGPPPHAVNIYFKEGKTLGFQFSLFQLFPQP